MCLKIYLKENLKKKKKRLSYNPNEEGEKSNEVERPKLIPEALAKFP